MRLEVKGQGHTRRKIEEASCLLSGIILDRLGSSIAFLIDIFKSFLVLIYLFICLYLCCLDSPPHPLVDISLSSSPFSSSATPSQFFTLSFQAQNLRFQQILPTLDFFYTDWTAFMIMGLDRTYHAHHFIFSFTFQFFLFIPCGGLSWLPVVSDFDLLAATISSYHDIVAARSAVRSSPSRSDGLECAA